MRRGSQVGRTCVVGTGVDAQSSVETRGTMGGGSAGSLVLLGEDGGSAAGGFGVVGGVHDVAQAGERGGESIGAEPGSALLEHGADGGEVLLNVRLVEPLHQRDDAHGVLFAELREVLFAVAPGVEEVVVVVGEGGHGEAPNRGGEETERRRDGVGKKKRGLLPNPVALGFVRRKGGRFRGWGRGKA